MNRLDNDLQKAIHKKTAPAQNHKDEMFDNILNAMEENRMNKQRRKSPVGMIAASLIVILLIAAIFTPPGRAAIESIIALFEKEKEVETEVEGEVETTEQQLQVGTTPSVEPEATPIANLMTYVMYIDESRYTFVSEGDVDIIKPIDYPEDYPEVYMEITQVLDKTKEEVSAKLLEQVKSEYDTVYDPYETDIPLTAIVIDAHDGDNNGTKETMPQWNSDVVKYYLVDNTQGGTFVIKMRYFVEAEEGHGSRFMSMMNEFVVVPAE